MDESEDVYRMEADMYEFVERGVKALGGDIKKPGAISTGPNCLGPFSKGWTRSPDRSRSAETSQ